MKCIRISRMRDMWKSASMFKTEDKLFIPIKPGNVFQRQQ